MPHQSTKAEQAIHDEAVYDIDFHEPRPKRSAAKREQNQ
jgi:hypothetical protein